MQLCYETERLYLKILKEDAAKDVLDFYLNNKEVFERYEPDRPKNFYTHGYQSALLNCEFNLAVKQASIRFWVFPKETPEQIIGTISFHNITRAVYQSCQLGYKFDQRFWRRGFARESIRKAAALMFDEVKLHRIEAMVLPSNEASIRLLEALQFENEGICHSCIYLHGRWTDHLRFSLIHP